MRATRTRAVRALFCELSFAAGPTASRATANATLTWIATLGSAAGLAAGGLLIDRIGLPGTMDVLGTGVVIGIALTLFLPETKGARLDQAGYEPI